MRPALRQVWRAIKTPFLIVAMALALYSALGFAGVPWALRYALEHKVAPLLARPLSVGEIRFNPYALRLEIDQFKLEEPDGKGPFVAFERLKADAAWESLFRLSPVIESVTLTQPFVHIERTAEQRFNFTDLIERFTGAPETPEPKREPAQFSVANIRIDDGTLRFDDTVVGAQHVVEHLVIGLPLIANRPAFTDVFVQPALQATVDGSPFQMQAQTKPFSPTQESELHLKLAHLDLPRYLGYAPATLPVKVKQGELNADVSLAFAQHASHPTLRLKVEAQVDGLSVHDRLDQPLLDVQRIAAEGLTTQPLMRVLNIQTVRIEQPDAVLARDRDGGFNLTRLSAPPAKRKPSSKPQPETAPAAPFQWRIEQLLLSEGRLRFTDLSNAEPVKVAVSPLTVTLKDVSQDFSKPWNLEVMAVLNGKGHLHTTGTVALDPLQARVHVDDDQLDVAIFAPYFSRYLNATVARAYAHARGDATFAMPKGEVQVSFRGETGLKQLRVLDKKTADLLAGWDNLSIAQVRFDLGPAGTNVQTGRITLDKFQARIFLDANGQLNLSRIVAREDAPNPSLTRIEPEAASTPVASAASAPATPSKVKLRFGEIVLSNGRVDFSDHYIQPNYNADLSAINGKVGTVGTQVTQPATVELSARLNGNDPLSISGSLNPLAATPSLDITASAQGVTLTHFATYTAHYTGYPIVAGKLSLDLHYKLDNGQLNAQNHVFIDQLTFGDHIEGDSVFNLPIRLAVSLLKNTKGQIDLTLPVTGSLSDPQFRIGSVVWQVIQNLIMKAVTSPFSLLASAFGGSEELGYLEFAPGSALLSPASVAKLQTLSQALNDRPAAKLDLIGRVDPGLDTPALRTANVEQQIKAQKLKTLVGKGESIDPDTVTVTPEERTDFLREAYADADFDRERNFIGLLKSQPPEVMQKLLEAHVTVGAAELQQLAQQRAQAVQQWLQGKLDASRVFIAAPKLDADGIADKGATTRLEFGLK